MNLSKKVFIVAMIISLFFVLPLDSTAQISVHNVKDRTKTKVKQKSRNKNDKKDKKDKKNKKKEEAKILYVSISSGSNKNEGTKDSPLKNIDKAIEVANPGDIIYIAEGRYAGKFGIGFLECDKPIKMYGSWDKNFNSQDVVKHPTRFQPDNESASKSRKDLLSFTKDVDGTVIDGIVFEMGERNLYSTDKGVVEGLGGRLMYPNEKPKTGGYSTVQKCCIAFGTSCTGGDVTISNCVFVNSAYFAIEGGHRSGKFTIRNNVFVANRFGAIEIFGTCAGSNQPKDMVSCGEVEIAYNTILFTWSRLKDFQDMGYAVRIMTKCSYNIHHNIIGTSILSGISNNRFCKDEYIKIDHNIMFGNKKGDIEYSPASNTLLFVNVDEFDDLEFASVEGNIDKVPEIPVNVNYLKGFYSARYSENTNYDPNSSENQWARALGMNQQGKMTSTSTMFMNKYPWKETLKLFGASKGYGAQTPSSK